ncbi:MAG: phosphatidate cytidylyltransferase [Lewinellaceae bacterium]|nr:phosphatidate cytidylyltransferase [Lewinellaceae bacterium]
MKKQMFYFGSLMTALSTLSGCEVIGGIFKAGVWSGILLVVLGIALIVFLISKLVKK